jgi:serine/threonine-protein kinase
MNHHARLVLFLRANGVITELEAEEYLNPAALGGQASSAQPNMQARHAVRAGMVAHGVTLGMLALMLGLIHVAPLGATPDTKITATATPGRGYLRVHAYPWAKISIDGKDVGTTPLTKALEVADGVHTIRFEHDWYEPVDKPLDVSGGSPDAAPLLSVDFVKDNIKPRAGKVIPGGGAP